MERISSKIGRAWLWTKEAAYSVWDRAGKCFDLGWDFRFVEILDASSSNTEHQDVVSHVIEVHGILILMLLLAYAGSHLHLAMKIGGLSTLLGFLVALPSLYFSIKKTYYHWIIKYGILMIAAFLGGASLGLPFNSQSFLVVTLMAASLSFFPGFMIAIWLRRHVFVVDIVSPAMLLGFVLQVILRRNLTKIYAVGVFIDAFILHTLLHYAGKVVQGYSDEWNARIKLWHLVIAATYVPTYTLTIAFHAYNNKKDRFQNVIFFVIYFFAICYHIFRLVVLSIVGHTHQAAERGLEGNGCAVIAEEPVIPEVNLQSGSGDVTSWEITASKNEVANVPSVLDIAPLAMEDSNANPTPIEKEGMPTQPNVTHAVLIPPQPMLIQTPIEEEGISTQPQVAHAARIPPQPLLIQRRDSSRHTISRFARDLDQGVTQLE